MKQGNGADLFGAADPRSGNTGIITVTPDDDREGVVAAILTQDKLGRKQILLVLPADNKAFQRPIAFDGLKNMRRRLQAQLIIVAPSGSAPAEFARQRRFPVYYSLEAYKNSPPPEQKRRLFPPLPAPDAHEPVSPVTGDAPEQVASETGDFVPENIDASKSSDELTGTSETPAKKIENEQRIIYLSPDDDLNAVEERLRNTAARRIVLVVPPQTQLRSLVSWRLIHGYARESGKEIAVISSDRAIRAVVKSAGLITSDSLESPSSGPREPRTGRSVPRPRVPPPPGEPSSQDQPAQEIPPVSPPVHEEDILIPFPMPPEMPTRPGPPPVPPGRNRDSMSSTGMGAEAGAAPVRRTTRPLSQQPRSVTLSPRRVPAPPSQRQDLRPFSIALLAIIAFILLGGLLFWLYATHSAYASSATVTITPASAAQDHRYTITAVTGMPNAAQRQVQARILSYTTSTQTMTVKATGQGTIPAVAAVGNLTFYNALPYSQTIAPGTILTDSSGVQIMNTKVAIIPAANLPMEGSIAVSARAVVPGASGNIPALDFNAVLCCIPGITVVNTAAFSGGHDQQHYTYVQQADINSVASTMKNSLAQNGESTLKTLLPPNEPLVGSIRCVPTVASDHSAGERAASVTISATDTCTGETYDQQAALAMAGSILRGEAASRLGAGFTLAGNIVATVRQAAITTAMNTVSLSVEADGTWVYRFTADRQSALAKLIAGKSGQAAKMLLQQQRGVSTASIQASFLFPWLDAAYLPADARQITIKMQG